MEVKHIRIRLLRNKDTGLLMAMSQDLKGLVVHGHSVEEIDARLPSVVRDLLEMDGIKVASVEVVEDKTISVVGFGPPAYVANVALRAA